MSAKINVFIAYAPEDEALKEQLERHLSILKRNQFIDIWHNRRIEADADWSQKTSQYLDTSQLILLLISPDFLASDYLYQTELKSALKKHYARQATVIPILLRPCIWQMQELEMLNVLPTSQEAVTSNAWESTDAAFQNITENIKKEVMHYLPLRTNNSTSSSSSKPYSLVKIAVTLVAVLVVSFLAYQMYSVITDTFGSSNTAHQNTEKIAESVSTNKPQVSAQSLTLNTTAAQPITLSPGDFQYERVYSVVKGTVESTGGNTNLVTITVGINYKGIINQVLSNDNFRLIAPGLKGPLAPANFLSKIIDSKSYGEGDVKFDLDNNIRKFTVQLEGKEDKKWDFSIEE